MKHILTLLTVLLLVPPGVITSSWNDFAVPLRFLAVHFDFHFCGGYQRRDFCEQPAPKQSHHAVELAIRFLESHCNRSLRISDIATAARLNPIYLERLFKRVIGHSPMIYLSRLRVGRAKHLLCRAGLTVKEVASAVGFEDAGYFTRVFQKFEGMSPMHYRRMTRELEGLELAISLTRSPRTGGGPHFSIPPRKG